MLPPDYFERVDETDDERFYSQPRLVVHIDDAAIGCPLIYPKNGARPYVDWIKVEKLLEESGFL